VLVPSREIIWPIQTMVKPNMPVGRVVGGFAVLIGKQLYLQQAHPEVHHGVPVFDDMLRY
jgi:hypothetical protein